MKKETKEASANRTTVTLPPELNDEAAKLCGETGVSLSDLCRQGIVRVLLERRETGGVRLLTLPVLPA